MPSIILVLQKRYIHHLGLRVRIKPNSVMKQAFVMSWQQNVLFAFIWRLGLDIMPMHRKDSKIDFSYVDCNKKQQLYNQKIVFFKIFLRIN